MQSSVDGAGFTNRASFTIDVGEDATISLNLEGFRLTTGKLMQTAIL